MNHAKHVKFSNGLEYALCSAVEKCDLRKIKEMLKLGADINLKTEDGITSMHWACGLGDEPINKQIIELLLAKGGNPNVRSVDGVTPVHVSASWGFYNILKVLVSHGGDPWAEDQEGSNSWDLALQKNQWMVLKYLASYMEQEPVEPVAETSVQCIFVGHREVKDMSYMSASANSTIGSSNIGFLESNSALSFSSSSLNNAICNLDSTTTSSSSLVIVEELLHTDSDKGVNLIEWHYPPLLNQSNTITDATLNEALCSTEDKDSFMDSQVLMDELKSLGTTPGPITATTKNIYLRQLYRLRKEQAVQAPSPQRLGLSKELQSLIQSYPGNENDMKIASQLDRLLVTHFSCPDPAKPWREGLSKKSFNYLLLDPRVTHNLPLNESQDQSLLFKRFISSIFYIGKGKQVRPHEHLYEAVKLRNRPQGFVKIGKKVKRILDIWDDNHGIISIHVFQNSLPVEAYCREAAMLEAIGLSNLTNVKRGDFYGICTGWSNSDKRRWGSHLVYKAFHIFLHEGERQIRPVDL